MTARSFHPEICDLCGSPESATLIALSSGRAMRSDRAVDAHNLVKVVCSRCGLVRSGQNLEGNTLTSYYTDDYKLSTQPVEHYFYTKAGPVSRSSMICDWLMQSMGAYRWRAGSCCLEIGAGAGDLMQEFIQRLPNISIRGLELNKNAVEIAQSRRLDVSQGSFEVLGDAQFDIIYSIAVVEHVPSPTEFLQQVRAHLSPGGLFFLCQPTQDVPSYDVYFIDHLHHFGTDHLRQYARKCGFRELGLCVGHEWMPNFSLHLWQASDFEEGFDWQGEPGFTTCADTANTMQENITGLNNVLHDLKDQRVAVFGLNEVYWLARAYTDVGDYPIVCGLDDMPDKPEYTQLGFPVVKPEDCLRYGVKHVILTMNKVYYAQATERLNSLGLTVHPFLT